MNAQANSLYIPINKMNYFQYKDFSLLFKKLLINWLHNLKALNVLKMMSYIRGGRNISTLEN